MDKHLKDFSKILGELGGMGRKRSKLDAFRDFLVMSRAAIANRYYKDPDIEKEYETAAKGYDEKEREKMAEMLGIVHLALNESHRDFLGEVYMGEGLGNSHAGQFFTPFTISEFMAKTSLIEVGVKKEIENKGFVTVLDPSVGSGGMLIAAHKVVGEFGHDPADTLYLQGQDIDAMCCHMTFIQLSALGAAARVVHCNSLIDSEYYGETITPRLATDEWVEKFQKWQAAMKKEKSGIPKAANVPEYDPDLLERFASGTLF